MKKYSVILALVAYSWACREQNIPASSPPARSPDFARGERLFYSNSPNKDSSFYYFNQVVINSRDSLEIAMAYNYMAFIQSNASDYFNSQESALSGLAYLDRNNPNHHYSLFSIYTMLGNSCTNLKNYDAAISYYDSALKFTRNDTSRQYALNGKAVVAQKMGNYEEAIQYYSSILPNSIHNSREYARILSNLARAQWLADATYPVLPQFWTALAIRHSEKDNWGLNASYSHLSDYYAGVRRDSAFYYARKMYEVAQLINSPDDQLEALQKLISLGPESEVKQYALRYQQISDSIQTVRNNAKNQFVLIRYETDKIKAEKLLLEKDNAEKQSKITRQRAWMYGIVLFATLIFVVLYNRYKKRQQRLQWEMQNAIRENKLELSHKVHDVVANGLYTLMTRLEHGPAMNKEEIQDHLEELYEKSRNIAYENPVATNTGFQKTIADILEPFLGPELRINTVNNDNKIWKLIPHDIKKELEHILRELMVNMKKHSEAKSVVLKFDYRDNLVTILYQDDGKGLGPSVQYGHGLTSTENRIKKLNGSIIFEPLDEGLKKGLRIHLSIPIPPMP